MASTGKGELVAGLTLMGGAALGIIAANTTLSPAYDALRDLPVSIRIGAFAIDKPLLLWINDGLMAVFFFLVGLELKREILAGELSSPSKAVVPLVCAVGGMVVPALIYFQFTASDPVAVRGWAIPAATDIAFALGVLALVGSRVPIGIKVLLTAIAVIDDLGAIVVIALFYTDELALGALAVWAGAVAALALLNRLHVVRIAPYVLIGVIAWAALLKSGVHATLAGVVAAFFVPMHGKGDTEKSPLLRLEEELTPVVGLFIVPLFGFCNAGVSFAGMTWSSLLTPITLGVASGLFLGKQIGVLASMFVMHRMGIKVLPLGATWLHVHAMSLLCGIGFTMSLFIAGLAFADPRFDAPVRLGVLAGSLLAASAAVAMFRIAGRRRESADDPAGS